MLNVLVSSLSHLTSKCLSRKRKVESDIFLSNKKQKMEESLLQKILFHPGINSLMLKFIAFDDLVSVVDVYSDIGSFVFGELVQIQTSFRILSLILRTSTHIFIKLHRLELEGECPIGELKIGERFPSLKEVVLNATKFNLPTDCQMYKKIYTSPTFQSMIPSQKEGLILPDGYKRILPKWIYDVIVLSLSRISIYVTLDILEIHQSSIDIPFLQLHITQPIKQLQGTMEANTVRDLFCNNQSPLLQCVKLGVFSQECCELDFTHSLLEILHLRSLITHNSNGRSIHLKISSLKYMKELELENVFVSVNSDTPVSLMRYLRLGRVRSASGLLKSTSFPCLNFLLVQKLTPLDENSALRIYQECTNKHFHVKPYITSRNNLPVTGDVSTVLYCNNIPNLTSIVIFDQVRYVTLQDLHNLEKLKFTCKRSFLSSVVPNSTLFTKLTFFLTERNFEMFNSLLAQNPISSLKIYIENELWKTLPQHLLQKLRNLTLMMFSNKENESLCLTDLHYLEHLSISINVGNVFNLKLVNINSLQRAECVLWFGSRNSYNKRKYNLQIDNTGSAEYTISYDVCKKSASIVV